jgi:hypothetical protein
MNPSWLFKNILKYFWFRIRWGIRLFMHIPTLSMSTDSFILMIRTDSFGLFSEYKQIIPYIQQIHTGKFYFEHLPCSAYSPYRYRLTPCILAIRKETFQYMYRFISCIQLQDHFEYSDWNLFFTFKGTLLQQNCNFATGSKAHKG